MAPDSTPDLKCPSPAPGISTPLPFRHLTPTGSKNTAQGNALGFRVEKELALAPSKAPPKLLPFYGRLLSPIRAPATDSLLLLYDDAQSIYQKSRGLDFRLSSVGIKAAGRTSILRLNYRNTREILQFACEFASKFMGAKAADDDHIPMIQPETGGASGPGPVFRQFASIGDEIAYATKCLKAWHERGDFLGDIAVICMKPDHGKRIAHHL